MSPTHMFREGAVFRGAIPMWEGCTASEAVRLEECGFQVVLFDHEKFHQAARQADNGL